MDSALASRWTPEPARIHNRHPAMEPAFRVSPFKDIALTSLRFLPEQIEPWPVARWFYEVIVEKRVASGSGGFPDFAAHASDLSGHRHPHWLWSRKEPTISMSYPENPHIGTVKPYSNFGRSLHVVIVSVKYSICCADRGPNQQTTRRWRAQP